MCLNMYGGIFHHTDYHTTSIRHSGISDPPFSIPAFSMLARTPLSGGRGQRSVTLFNASATSATLWLGLGLADVADELNSTTRLGWPLHGLHVYTALQQQPNSRLYHFSVFLLQSILLLIVNHITHRITVSPYPHRQQNHFT